MSEDQIIDLPDVEDAGEEGMFNTADIVVFVLFVVGLIVFFFYKKYQESTTVTIKPISLQQLKTGVIESGLDIVKRMTDSSKKMVVFYGSQTGTAEEFATRLCKEARYYGISAMSADPVEYDVETLKELRDVDDHISVFLMATYGEGEPTDNALQFHEFIKNEETDLSGLNYAVFGLGNSTYEYYNKMGKDTDELLEKRGAYKLSALGLGDDDGNIEDDYMNWREAFWADICKKFGVVKSDARFRHWVREINQPGYPGIMSLRMFISYASQGRTVPRGWLPPSSMTTEVLNWVRRSMRHFTRKHINCWVHSENLDVDLQRCLAKWEKQSGQTVDWSGYDFAKQASYEKRSDHGKCEDYFDPDTKKLMRDLEGNLFDKFGYDKCCG